MVKIVHKKVLNPSVTLLEVEAPLIAKKAKAGQFIILRLDEQGERIPLTIADYDREKGTVTIIFQKVGLTTELLAELNEGDSIRDFVGPLGLPTELPRGQSVSAWWAEAWVAPSPIPRPRPAMLRGWRWT